MCVTENSITHPGLNFLLNSLHAVSNCLIKRENLRQQRLSEFASHICGSHGESYRSSDAQE